MRSRTRTSTSCLQSPASKSEAAAGPTAHHTTETNCLKAESAVALILAGQSLYDEEKRVLDKALDTIRDIRKRQR